MLIHAVLQGLLCAALLLTPALSAQEMPASAGEDQVIYVNPDGGRYYHASVQCDMLAPEFRPGMRRYEGEQAQLLLDTVPLEPCPSCISSQEDAFR